MYYGEPTGSCIDSSSRTHPHFLKKQPNTTLIYYVVVISPTEKTQFTFTNRKLVKIRNLVQDNEYLDMHPVWYQQGEEIGKINCGSAYVLVMCNRLIDFASDVSYMSKMTPASEHLARPLDCIVRTNDIVGYINWKNW